MVSAKDGILGGDSQPTGSGLQVRARYEPPKVPKRMDPVLPVLSILEYWPFVLGTSAGPASGESTLCSSFRDDAKSHHRSSNREASLTSGMGLCEASQASFWIPRGEFSYLGDPKTDSKILRSCLQGLLKGAPSFTPYHCARTRVRPLRQTTPPKEPGICFRGKATRGPVQT